MQKIRIQLIDLLSQAIKGFDLPQTPAIAFETPPDKALGDLSSNLALLLAKPLKKSPLLIAKELVTALEAQEGYGRIKHFIQKVEIKAPGFMNFYLTPVAYYDVLYEILEKRGKYGESNFGAKKKIQVEFVSANPTGPLTVAHGRQAAVGDSLVNILRFIGFDAYREYYINDEGNQINILGRSIHARAKEILGETIEFPEDGYQGGYIKDMAAKFLSDKKIKDSSVLEKVDADEYRQFGVEYLMALIKKDLLDFGVQFDVWSSQAKIASPQSIADVLDFLQKKGHIYENDGALWFKSTAFGDDKDRVVKKSDGSYTYLMPDIVYHKDKFARGFQTIIDILGPDHHGYIPRIKAAAAALGHSVDDVYVLIVQLASIFRNGQPVSMSTRRGEFISLREVIDEVGRDAGRFFFLMRQTSAHLDFDLELAKKESPENPVYYIQYAHARILSIIRKAAEESHIKPKTRDLTLLVEEEAIDLMRQASYFPDVLLTCAKQYDPFPLVRYLQELAASFHRFYDRNRVLSEDPVLSAERLALIDGARVVLANGLTLLGVAAPEKM